MRLLGSFVLALANFWDHYTIKTSPCPEVIEQVLEGDFVIDCDREIPSVRGYPTESIEALLLKWLWPGRILLAAGPVPRAGGRPI